MNSTTLSLATLGQFVGCELGVTDWLKIDQQRIDRFAECTGDHQWIHVDVERAARESPFKTTVAHGYLVLATVAPAAFDVLVQPARIPAVLNYGLDKAHFINPVKAGSCIRHRVKLLAAESKGADRTLIATEHTIEIEGEDKPAAIVLALTMALG